MFYLGVDVSQLQLKCTLLLDPDKDKHKTKVVANSMDGVYVLVLWCGKQGVPADLVHAVVDGAGPYHQFPATLLHDCGVTISIVDPSNIRDFGRDLPKPSRLDAIDARALAHYGFTAQPVTWQPPPAHARELDALTAQLDSLRKDRLCSQNRREMAEASGAPALVDNSISMTLLFYDAEIARLQKAIKDHISHHADLMTGTT